MAKQKKTAAPKAPQATQPKSAGTGKPARSKSSAGDGFDRRRFAQLAKQRQEAFAKAQAPTGGWFPPPGRYIARLVGCRRGFFEKGKNAGEAYASLRLEIAAVRECSDPDPDKLIGKSFSSPPCNTSEKGLPFFKGQIEAVVGPTDDLLVGAEEMANIADEGTQYLEVVTAQQVTPQGTYPRAYINGQADPPDDDDQPQAPSDDDDGDEVSVGDKVVTPEEAEGTITAIYDDGTVEVELDNGVVEQWDAADMTLA